LIEASVKLKNYQKNQANLILLSQSTSDYNNAYLVSINSNKTNPQNPTNELFAHKRIIELTTQKEKQLINSTLPNSLDGWMRIRSYVYISKNIYWAPSCDIVKTEATEINNTLYDSASFSEFNQSYTIDGCNYVGVLEDPEEIPGDPYPTESPFSAWFGGKIGFGCGLLTDSTNPVTQNGSVQIDWIRALKLPLVSPKVTIGAPETKNCYWSDTSSISTSSYTSSDPFSPGPLLCDYHSCGVPNSFLVYGLDGGIEYKITITKGREDTSSPGMAVVINSESIIFDNTSKGVYQTKSATITKTDDKNHALFIQFTSTELQFMVNSIVIERVDETGLVIK
jgi:hypothetical protein